MSLESSKISKSQMSTYMKIVRERGMRKVDKKHMSGSYSWKKLLRDFEKGNETFVQADAFNNNLVVSFNEVVKEDVVFETIVSDYDEICDDVKIRWFARVLKVCGYRVLAKYVGSKETFWVHFLSDTVYPLADCSAWMKNPKMTSIIYGPPLSIGKAYQADMPGYTKKIIESEVVGKLCLGTGYELSKIDLTHARFLVGQRLELLNYNDSTEIRVARIQEVCGRRLKVLIMKEDYPEALPNTDDDRQVYGKKSEYWLDEESFLIFPVGFAAYNKYKLCAKEDYVEHTRAIAEALERGEEPDYHPDDIGFNDLRRESVDKNLWDLVKVGMKFELIDPLAQTFKNLRVASVMDLMRSDGYMVIGVDGPDQQAERLPIHISNVFMFSIGSGAKWGIEVVPPEDYKKAFNWDSYLTENRAEPLPVHLFRPMPDKGRMAKFEIGMHLEAADMCENQFICPATIKSIHGRIINVHYDGWDSEYDELYDVDSHDILPVGWCELHNYFLQQPKTDGY